MGGNKQHAYLELYNYILYRLKCSMGLTIGLFLRFELLFHDSLGETFGQGRLRFWCICGRLGIYHVT